MIWTSTLILCGIGALAALLLYLAAKKFHVEEDPRIDTIEELLPGANCGGCGFSGCRAFATACAKADSLEGLLCPGGGNATMKKIATIVGLASVTTIPKVAVVRCNGTCSSRPKVAEYEGVRKCAIEAMTGAADSLCQYGCLGCGDCVAACPYDAMHMDFETGIPVVDISKCVGCAKCVKACPRGIVELAPLTDEHPLVYVACSNHDKGAAAMKECEVSCIGCTKCVKVCPTQAVSMDRFLSHIDYTLCIGCGKCIEACPHHSILSEVKPAKSSDLSA